jgi:S1-C subfamily serine protease
MAHSVAEALNKFPGARMVVLAGNGHFQNSWGIPDRIKRLTDIRPVIVMNSSGERITRTIADYVLYPQRSKAPEPPLLMVELKETKEGIEVMKVSKGGPADKAGIEASDILKTIDGAKIEGIADIKIALLDKKPGDIVRLSLLRKRFLLGPKEMDVEVTLQ